MTALLFAETPAPCVLSKPVPPIAREAISDKDMAGRGVCLGFSAAFLARPAVISTFGHQDGGGGVWSEKKARDLSEMGRIHQDATPGVRTRSLVALRKLTEACNP